MSKKTHTFRHAVSAPVMSAQTLSPRVRPYTSSQIGSSLMKTPSEIPMPSQMKGNLVFRGWMKKKSDWWGKFNPRFVTLGDDGLFEWSAKEGKKDSEQRVVHGSFYLNDYQFRMESSNDTQKYRLKFISKSQNLEKNSKMYEFEPNTNADAHGWSNAIANVMSRIRAKSSSISDSGKKSLLKVNKKDICRKKGLILTQNGEMSCPIRRSLKSLIMRSSAAYVDQKLFHKTKISP